MFPNGHTAFNFVDDPPATGKRLAAVVRKRFNADGDIADVESPGAMDDANDSEFKAWGCFFGNALHF
jgi:hypothetical protein